MTGGNTCFREVVVKATPFVLLKKWVASGIEIP